MVTNRDVTEPAKILLHRIGISHLISLRVQIQMQIYYANYLLNNNNNNNQDNVYGAVIMAEPLREFTRFI